MITVKKEHCVYAMDPRNKPALKAPAGSVIEFETADCFGGQIKTKKDRLGDLDWNRINPATGPVYIRGAQPGDALKIEIKKIAVADQGVMSALPEAGLFGSSIKQPEVKIIPIKNGNAVFSDTITLNVAPMIGVIGTAPKDESISCGTPGTHGGNMDNKMIKEGATLYLPVEVPGGLLAMGDLHACMGDGEVMVSGVEVGGTVQVFVDVIKEAHLTNPMLEDEEQIYTIASATDLLKAVKQAAGDMHKLIMAQLHLSYNEAGMLISAAGDAQICQVVDPLVTARFSMPKRLLPRGKQWGAGL